MSDSSTGWIALAEERAASHRRIILALAWISFGIQVATLLLMLWLQREVRIEVKNELLLLETYNQNTRERLGVLEERMRWAPPAK